MSPFTRGTIVAFAAAGVLSLAAHFAMSLLPVTELTDDLPRALVYVVWLLALAAGLVEAFRTVNHR